jgi:carboxymethylenebutenolidase
MQLKAERIYWDQASVLVQIGLLSKEQLPCVTGAEQALKMQDQDGVPSNLLIKAQLKKQRNGAPKRR